MGRLTENPVVNINNKSYLRLHWVQIDLEKDSHDHLISAEERFKVAMARQ
jgi:hypothetical protein